MYLLVEKFFRQNEDIQFGGNAYFLYLCRQIEMV